MSSYLTVYIKTKDDIFLPIGTYSRNSAIYEQVRDFVPYGSGIKLALEKLRQISNAITEELSHHDEFFNKLKQERIDILMMTNSVEEKQDALYDLAKRFDAFDDITKELLHAQTTVMHWINLVENIQLAKTYYPEQFGDWDPDNYICAGIEWSPYKEENE